MNPGQVKGDPFHRTHGSHLGSSRIDREEAREQDLMFDADNPDDERFFTDLSIFRDDDEDDASHTSSDAEIPPNQQTLLPSDPPPADPVVSANPNSNNPNSSNVGRRGKAKRLPPMYISPEAHMSSSFYTFNKESHCLMLQCLRDCRLATAEEVRAATPDSVLSSWRAVWRDRNEDTAYLTAWKRIQDKLSIHVDPMNGNEFLCFKTNYNQFIPYVDQWHDIVMNCHCDDDFRHLGVKETVEGIKQTWTVGAKFYGIPESFIRSCVLACPICSDESSGCAPRNKRRRFEYTESFEVPAKDVPTRLQQLATKHKVVLCIRQKYIRYKPFMAEVKDYACHRAGEPASSKKSRSLKREPYASKRCGCGFRIRAIVPISNYSEKEKTFIYEEEGTAVFKLYAKHTGHQPGPLDGNARIMHRVVGHKGGIMLEQDAFHGMSDEAEIERFGFLGNNENLQHSVLHQMCELRNELGFLEGKIGKIPPEALASVSRDLYDIVHKLRNVGEYGSKTMELLQDKHDSVGVLVGENDLGEWAEHQHSRLYGDGKNVELLDDDDDSFGRTLGDVPWEQIRTGSRIEKDLLSDSCKAEKWLSPGEFDEKSMLDCGDSKMTKRVRHGETLDAGLGGIQVDNFYPENPKWFDPPCGLGSSADCGDGEFRHGGIV
ncbi:OLC1v1002318C1 [Oldenlandia corymbosa var. corymbosa]|uniref:OLC1v1002318C1 n=1 Tax=Oldenlandia corymbosa var. corymbosa TaxID=529605 RepID=A0AAV1D9P7_OLDCO|nr:OLC1v1002318C1 [Oldenlandia corymbosa var. corymbosa]